MFRRRAFLVAAFLVLLPAAHPAAAICGRPDYPNATAFDEASVVDAPRWQAFRDDGGFIGGNEGQGGAEVRVDVGSTTIVIRVEEVELREYIGGASTDVTLLALRVREERGAQIVAVHNFTLVSAGGRAGGNVTVVGRLAAAGLDVFWRWAYLPCEEDFPNSYYVFYGRVEDGRVVDDNVLVYFEAPRPRRGPPVDLILLVAAGIAVSVIFLLARRALKTQR